MCEIWVQDGPEGEYTVHFNSYAEGGKVGKPDSIKVDVVIGADGANSRVAKEIDAGAQLCSDHVPLASCHTMCRTIHAFLNAQPEAETEQGYCCSNPKQCHLSHVYAMWNCISMA